MFLIYVFNYGHKVSNLLWRSRSNYCFFFPLSRSQLLQLLQPTGSSWVESLSVVYHWLGSCNAQEYDVNLDGLLDREEFAEFIRKLTADSLCSISVKLLITLVAAPALAMATKRATEGVPGVGKVVRKVPNALYASAITLGVVLVQRSTEGVE